MSRRPECRFAPALEAMAPRIVPSGTAPSSAVVTASAGQSQANPTEGSRTGDVNGDGLVDFADLSAFAPAFRAHRGQPRYLASADFNGDGVINQADARVMLRSMAPIAPKIPLAVPLLHLIPRDTAHYRTPKVSGGATFKQVVTIVGRTTPGSLVIEDNQTSRLPGGNQAYKFTGPAHATDARGYFKITALNREGINNNNFLILDPFGRSLIRAYPIYWIPYASGGGPPKPG